MDEIGDIAAIGFELGYHHNALADAEVCAGS